MGDPLDRWMVFLGNIPLKWMMTRGTPILGNLHIDNYRYDFPIFSMTRGTPYFRKPPYRYDFPYL